MGQEASKKQILVVGRPEHVASPEEVGAAGLCVVETIDQALTTLVEEAPPRAVVIAIGFEDGKAFDLMAGIDALRLQVPVLLLREEVHGSALPWPPSCHLGFAPAGLGVKALEELVARIEAQSETRPDGAMFCFADYLMTVVSLGLSLHLYLRFRSDLEVFVRVVGGDIWSVLADNHSCGEDALAGLFLEPPLSVDVTPLRLLPDQRHERRSGPEVLRRLAVRAAAPSAESGTQPIDISHHLSSHETQAVQVEAETTVDPATAEAFEALFRSGLKAALERDYVLAIDLFERALRSRPSDPRVRFNLERVQRMLGR